MIVTRTVEAIDPVRLARRTGLGRLSRVLAIPDIPRPTLISGQLSSGGCSCSSQLGFVDLNAGTNQGNFSVLGAVAVGANFIPGVGPILSGPVSLFGRAISAFQSWLGIGSGRVEADVIVPRANELTSELGVITDQILAGSSPSLSQLDSLYREVWQLAVGYMEFVAMKDFADRRASGQALNTMMPYIDGTCGYPVPLPLRIPYPSQVDCLRWGDGTIGGGGTNGMLGAIARAIQGAGGAVPNLPSIIDSANDGIPVYGGVIPPGGVVTAGPSTSLAVGLGVLVLFFFSRRRVL
jgi:hypothetical protein